MYGYCCGLRKWFVGKKKKGGLKYAKYQSPYAKLRARSVPAAPDSTLEL